MKQLRLIFFLLTLLSCNEKVEDTEVENLRLEVFNSLEFKNLKSAYNEYLTYGKKNNTATALANFKGSPYLKDSILHYSLMADSLGELMKAKSKIFYSKYPIELFDMNPEEIKNHLTEK